jgi:hypothetical protein
MNLVAKGFCPSLSYMAISRVKALNGFLFKGPFDLDRFEISVTAALQDRKVDAIEQSKQLVRSLKAFISSK